MIADRAGDSNHPNGMSGIETLTRTTAPIAL